MKDVPEGRVGCLNPACRRTSRLSPDMEEGDWIICRPCWNLLPAEIKAERKRIGKINRKLDRMSGKAKFGEHRSEQWTRIVALYERRSERHNASIALFFSGEKSTAELASFLREIGLDADI